MGPAVEGNRDVRTLAAMLSKGESASGLEEGFIEGAGGLLGTFDELGLLREACGRC